MADPVKRLHYFNGQFLREDDFTAEQEYHLRLRRLHNQLLHTWGIAEGLEVEFVAGATAVTVSQGTAFDSQGREIVLAEKKAVELAGFPADASVYVTIAYAEETTDPTEETGAEGRTRWTEEPLIEASANAPSDPGQKLVLDLVTRSGTEVTGQGEFPTGSPGRRSAGVIGGDLQVSSLTLTHPDVVSPQWPRLRLDPTTRRVDVMGDLNVSGTVTGKLGPNIVGPDQIADNAIIAPKLANGAVTGGKIANNAITVSKLDAATGGRVQTLTAGPDSDASALHHHATIPAQKKVYHVPLAPSPNAGNPQFTSNFPVMIAQAGQRASGNIPLYLPDGAQLTGIAINTTITTLTSFEVRVSLMRAIFGRNAPSSIGNPIIINVPGPQEKLLDHVIDNAAGRYFLQVIVQTAGTFDIVFDGIRIEYVLTRLF